MTTRFDRTATLISAGAGFGKSTLIAQTLADPVTASTVRYVTHRVGPTDADGAELERSLARQIGAIADEVRHPDDTVNPPTSTSTSTSTSPRPRPRPRASTSGSDATDGPSDVSLADQLWHLSPEYVTVVVDDIHLLPAASAGWDVLNDLVLDLPENADAILGGRGFQELRTARLIAHGEAIEITEEMLAFNADELEDFARLRGVDASSLDEHGWPALVELEAHAGIAGARSSWPRRSSASFRPNTLLRFGAWHCTRPSTTSSSRPSPTSTGRRTTCRGPPAHDPERRRNLDPARPLAHRVDARHRRGGPSHRVARRRCADPATARAPPRGDRRDRRSG